MLYRIEDSNPLPPPKLVLARVQTFLPQIEASNAILEQQAKIDPCSVNMEHVDDSTDQYIEMVRTMSPSIVHASLTSFLESGVRSV